MGRLKRRREEEIARASRVIFETENGQSSAPQINGKLRSFALQRHRHLWQADSLHSVLHGYRHHSQR